MHSLRLSLFLLTSTFSFSSAAADMFTFVLPNTSKSVNSTEVPNSFSVEFNAEALQDDEIIVNLPHKNIAATRMAVIGDVSEQITPYSFKTQKGAVTVNNVNGITDGITVFDEEAKEVFRGSRQADGTILFTQVDIDTYICDDFDTHNPVDQSSQQSLTVSYYQSLTDLTLSQVDSLQSRPGATNVIYIDYHAGSVSNTRWNVGTDAPAVIEYEDYSYDDDVTSFSLIDLQNMYAGWAETAEDYATFDVNVTTDLGVYNATPFRNKSKIIATSTNWRGSGGVAYVGVFGERNDDYFTIGWTFNKRLSSMGMTNSHESGHQMGLRHDGTPSREYYSGQGNSGPIMGGPFGKDFVQWNRGDYPDANQQQDDISIINARLGVVADDHGDSNDASSSINAQEITGFISPAGVSADIDDRVDTDVFNFTLNGAKNIDLTVRSLFEQFNQSGRDNTAGGLNLSAKVELRDESNNLIQQTLPSNNAASNNFTFSGNLSAGTYFLSIQNQAYSGANFSEYGNGGYYQILNNLEVSSGPDLLVALPSVNQSPISPGGSFVFSASVENRGNTTSSSTSLTYYRSTDEIIGPSDTRLGAEPIGALTANTASSRTVNFNAPDSIGDYYYGVCVTAVADELSTINNCSEGVLVKVAAVDLIVQAIVVSDNTLDTGEEFTLTASFKNQGNLFSDATNLHFYLSNDSTINESMDSRIRSTQVTRLNANISDTRSIQVNAPSSPGTYYYGACIETVNDEENTTNNCSVGVEVNLTFAPTIDLVVRPAFSTDSALDAEQVFTLSATVENQGNTASAASELMYYVSTNSTISTSDTLVDTFSFDALNAGSTDNVNVNLRTPASGGSYYYGVCVTPVVGETVRDNNCSQSHLIVVTQTVSADSYEPDNSSAEANTIANGRNQTHSIHVAGDKDWLTFNLTERANNIVIETSGSANHDTRLYLYDSKLAEVDFNDDGGVGTYSKIIVPQLAPGTYYILVDEFGDNDLINSYSISLNFDSIVSSADKEPLCVPIKTSNDKMAMVCL